MNQLLMAMIKAAQSAQPAQPQKLNARTNASALALAMAKGRAKVNPRDASLAALPPYGASKHADTLGGAPGNSSTGAFQSDAFQNDAFQVNGVA